MKFKYGWITFLFEIEFLSYFLNQSYAFLTGDLESHFAFEVIEVFDKNY